MKVLSLNTTGIGTQISLINDGKEFFVDAGFSKHSETLFPLLENLLVKANTTIDNLDFVGVVIGPGSFTGIRIGLAVAKTFCYVKGCKCVGVNSLEVLAYNIFNRKDKCEKPVCSVINAGADMVYYQIFESKNNKLIAISEPMLSKFKHFSGYIHSVYSDEVEFVYCNNNEKNSWADFIVESENFTPQSLNKCVLNKIEENKYDTFENIAPLYLRTSQAEKLIYKEDEIKIIQGTLNDIDVLCEMESQDDPIDLQWSKTSLEQSFENKSYKCWILKSKEKALGYVSIIDLTDEYEILRIVVLKNARLQGLGMKLLNFVFEQAQNNNVKNVLLEVNDHNYPALSLYQKMGFEKIGERKQYYSKRENAILMKKVL